VTSTLLPCRSVGVQGDCRSYRSLVGLSTSSSSSPNWNQLLNIAREIPKKNHSVNRVVYVFGSELKESVIKTITPTVLSKDCTNQLRAADDIVNQTLVKYDLIRKLSQVPVILFPCDFGVKGSRAIAVRTFITNDFMTGVPATPGKEMPSDALSEIVSRILKEVPGVSRVCYDLTSKPPATTEWE
jgi:GMP synthase (glutamine-hydrolysing)